MIAFSRHSRHDSMDVPTRQRFLDVPSSAFSGQSRYNSMDMPTRQCFLDVPSRAFSGQSRYNSIEVSTRLQGSAFSGQSRHASIDVPTREHIRESIEVRLHVRACAKRMSTAERQSGNQCVNGLLCVCCYFVDSLREAAFWSLHGEWSHYHVIPIHGSINVRASNAPLPGHPTVDFIQGTVTCQPSTRASFTAPYVCACCFLDIAGCNAVIHFQRASNRMCLTPGCP